MNKIAFIASGHTGSTMPLIKEFLNRGYKVDYYFLCNKVVKNVEATDCAFTPTKRGVQEISREYWPKLSNDYIKSESFRFFSISTYRPFESNKLLNKMIGVLRLCQIKNACDFINKQGYQLVNFIGRYQVSDIVRYAKFINTKYVVSLHEVCDHSNPDFEHPNSILSYLFSKSVPIVVFSDKSLEDIKKYKGSDKASLYRENFGLFESFKIYSGRESLDLPEDYILFIGRLTPYKGLRLFYESTKGLAKKGYKFVVAGSGNDEALNDIRLIDNYTIINRYLSDDDFVELIERCRIVICPYTSISQSGIPQTVFVFNKPIIATNLDGFKEVISHGCNGLLFELNKTESLRLNIEKLINDENLLATLENGAANLESLFPKYSWKGICSSYEKKFLK